MAELDEMTKNRMSRALSALSLRARPVAAYLFGSRAEGRADKWSDYDLAVFIEGAENWDLPGLARFCAAIQKEAGDDIELHVFPASQARDPEPASFAAFIITHGIRLPLEELAA
jgi:predicted nucleotidyltransferase